MRKRVKKPLALLMALLMMLTMFGSQVFAESTAPADAAAAVQGEEGTAGNDDDAGNAEIDSTAGTAAQDAGDGSQDADTKSAETADTVEYVPEEQPNGVTVKAYAAEGVLPDGAVMKVTMLDAEGDTADQYNEAAAALEESDVDHAGFLAMDISFYDAEGNEIEPEDGAVNVQFEVDESLLPEEAEADTLAVQHLAETEDGIQVETVADAADVTDGTVAVEGKAVTAEFSVESFSTFTITWSEDWFNYFRVTVHYVDEEGNPLDVEHEDISIDGVTNSHSQTYRFEDYAETVENYSYQEARYSETGNFNSAEPVVRMVASQNGYVLKTRYLTFYNSENGTSISDRVGSLTSDYYDYDTETAHIYLVYKADESGSGGSDISATVTTEKTAVLKDDESGNYDLTLSITGDRGQIGGDDVKVDILFILDESGSMDYKLDEDKDAGKREESRMDLLQEAVGDLIDTIEANADIDARYSAVSFSRSQDGDQVSWTNANGVRNFVNSLNPNGGTNYQQGIYDGKQLLNSARTDALTFVIFVSDGEPTYRGVGVTNSTDRWNAQYGNGSDDDDGDNIAAAVSEISNMSCDYFYAIGMGPEFGRNWNGNDLQGTTNLKSLANAVNATYKGDNNVYSASDTASLEQAFRDIATSITFFAAENVTITDPLSDYADIVLNGNGVAEFTITVTNGKGDTWKGTVASGGNLTFKGSEKEDITVTATYNEETKTITLDFPDNYGLEEGYTYSVSTVIKPSAVAVSKGMNSTEAQQTPDPNTGTHADQNENGFWSNDNDNAKVTFVANGSDGSEPFPKPVIQVQEVPTGNLTITKQVTGIDSGDLNLINGQKFTFNIKKLTSENGDTDTGFTDEELGFVNGVKQIAITGAGATTVEGLPEGYYCVEEVTDGLTAVGDYEYIGNSVSVDSVTIVSNTTVSVTVTNTYAHRDKTLTITKKVEGNMGDRDHDFEFEITVLNGNDTLLENDVYREIAGTAQKSGTALDNLTFNTEGKATFTLQNDQIFIITIPHGCQYIVEEVNNEGYNVTVEVNSGNGSYNSESGQLKGTLTADTSATFTNDRTVNPPTGLIHTSAPFAAMIIIALGAVVIFITGRRIRR